MHPTYAPAAQIRKLAGGIAITPSVLRTWASQNRVRFVRLPGGKRLYHIGDIMSLMPDLAQLCPASSRATDTTATKTGYLYARVSSPKQKEAGDLQRQIQTLQEARPNHTLVQDTASGLNYKRRGLRSLLGQCLLGVVSEVVVTHRDRLARFGVDLLEWLLESHGVKLVVLDHSDGIPEPSAELAEDLLAVCNFFVAKNNGRRAGKNKRRRKQAANPEGKTPSPSAYEAPGASVQEMAGGHEVDLE